MNTVWYHIVRIYVTVGLFFLFKKRTVFGRHNIPKKGAVLFIGNHQNALIDAILIPTTNKRTTYFLARASAFKNKIADKLLRTVNMIPVYRLRDGVNTIEKNYEIFEQCHEYLKNEKAVEIFAEGEHHLERRINPLKKGFARIIEGTLKKYPDLPITIVPVGLNYDTRLGFPSSTSIYYGEPIAANPYFEEGNADPSYKPILDKVTEALKELTIHIPHEMDYSETIKKLENANVNYLNPSEANLLLKNLDQSKIQSDLKKPINWFYPIHFIAKINSIIPILIWRYLKKGIKEVIFTNTFRFAVILTLFPLFYLIQTALVYSFFNGKTATIYLTATILLGVICTKTMPVNR